MASSRIPLPELTARHDAFTKALALWHTVNPRQMALLLAVHQLREPTCTKAGEVAGLSLATVTMARDALVARGWIEISSREPGDRRHVRLQLSRQGEAAALRFISAVPMGPMTKSE